MSATYAARASRQSVILAVTAALHAGVLLLVASGLGPSLIEFAPPPAIFDVPLPEPKETPEAAPDDPRPLGFEPEQESEPILNFPVFDDLSTTQASVRPQGDSGAGSGPAVPVEETAPKLRTRDSRLAALINSCYPSASRRMGEEGRAVARITIDGQGRVAHWAVERSSGFPRLDAAMDCVIRRLEFVPGRLDGRGVEATALLPIVFALD